MNDVPPRADPAAGAPNATRPVPSALAGAHRHARRRLTIVLWGLALAALAIFLVNTVVPSWHFEGDEWVFRRALPTMRPLGNDFQTGIYQPAQLVRAGRSPYEIANFYPPLVAVLGLPLTFLRPQVAYVLHVVALVFANVAALVLAMSLARRAFGATSPRHGAVARAAALPLLLVVGFLTVTSYAFTFSLERGNYDILPLLASIVVLWLLVERPRTLWLQAALLALAVHLKVYPLVLFPLLFWVHRWRSVVPLAALNGACLLVLGWGRATEFFSGLATAALQPALWVGNHSAAAFAHTALAPAGLSFRRDAAVLALVPLALLAAGALVLWRRGFTPVNALLAFALAVPVMNVVPATSHDYKLVILAAPMAMLLLGEVLSYAVDGGWRPIATIAVLLVLSGLLSHAYTIVTPYVVAEPGWLANRYLWILLVQAIAFAEVVAARGVFRSTSPA